MSEELRGDLLHESIETENKNEERDEVQRDISPELPDWLQEFRRIWLMKVLQQNLGETQSKEVKTLPSHLMNFQWSREQKWNRVPLRQCDTTVVTANGGANKRRGHGESQGTGFIRDSDASRRYTGRFFHSENSAKIISIITNQWSQTTSNQKWQTDKMQHSERRTLRCPWSIDKLFKLSYAYFSHTFIAGNCDSHGASSINKK